MQWDALARPPDVGQPISEPIEAPSLQIVVVEQYRDVVRDGETGAYRAFTAWHELTAFLADQLDQDRSSTLIARRRSIPKENKS
jgi:hypothetical protein